MVFNQTGDWQFEDNEDGTFQIEHEPTGTTMVLDSSDGSMSVKKIDNIVKVVEESDLPDATGSPATHSLNALTGYNFVGSVSINDPIELSTGVSPLLGSHGGLDAILYQGSGAAVRGTGAPLFMKDVRLEAPGATGLDISAGQDVDILVESVSAADPSGLGNMANLGTIDGFRVPSFKGCNFEEFDAGLTITGSPNKVFFSECPFRGVTESGVQVLDFDSNFSGGTVDITDCYVKDLQSDTEVVHVDASATIDDIFQYRGVTHETATVTKSNILTGQAGSDAKGFRVSDSFPLDNSGVSGSMNFSGSSAETVSGSGSSQTRVEVTTSTSGTERMLQQSNGILEYDAKWDTSIKVSLTISVSGSNSEFEVGMSKNSLPAQDRTLVRGFTPNSSNPVTSGSNAVFNVTDGDDISVTLENIGGNADLDVEAMQLTAVGV